LEASGRRATLYVTGRITAAHLSSLLAACDGMPDGVHTLTVSMDDIGRLGDDAPTIVHELRRHWQTTRFGGFRMTFAAESCNPIEVTIQA
jgi:hypothetical protein